MSLNIYRDVPLSTATPEESISLLYQGWQRLLHEAMLAIERGEIPRAHQCLVRCQTICGYLWAQVNREHPLGEKTESVLAFLHEELVRANVEKSQKRIQDILEVVEILERTWAANLDAAKGRAKAP